MQFFCNHKVKKLPCDVKYYSIFHISYILLTQSIEYFSCTSKKIMTAFQKKIFSEFLFINFMFAFFHNVMTFNLSKECHQTEKNTQQYYSICIVQVRRCQRPLVMKVMIHGANHSHLWVKKFSLDNAFISYIHIRVLVS